MTYIENLINDVEKTHKNAGKLMAISQIAVKARKTIMIISPSGCGKSTVMNLLNKNIENAIMPDKISVAGLAIMADRLTGFRSVIIVDDITTTQTEYARKTTITTLVALTYSHRIQTIMAGQEFTIDDFYGSAIIGVQPIILKSLMLLEEWDGSIQDKALRYYHMFRPLTPSISLPKIDFNRGLDIEKIQDFEPNINNEYWYKLLELGYSQWSRARTVEHMKDMLKSIACLENRNTVIDNDYTVLYELLKPMALENVVVTKEQLEGERYLNSILLLLLVEYYTYDGKFTLAQVAQDYKLSISQCYRIMASQKFFKQVSKSPTIYEINEQIESELKLYNLELHKNGVKNNE